jgi:DNA-binding CsgD family transcriptional regulator
MNRLIIILYVLAALLLASCTSGRHSEMLAQLEELERQNVADSLMTNDSLALALAEYFDRHGTPNEQLRAHYILGRTYADMGEAPAAIEAYLDAAECADTTAQDCNYHKLSRVYSQMSDVYYRQNLMQDYLHCLALSVCYAWMAEDTLQALREYAFQAYAYNQLHQTDTALFIIEKACDQLLHHGWEQLAAGFSLLPVAILLDSGRIEKAKYYLHLYDTKSGHFDSHGNISKGREVYYFYKGRTLALDRQYDSAEHYFRKELQFGGDYYNQQLASRGLALLYKQLHQQDSATKYAFYSYDMMDSVYARMATKEVERTAALFRYNRYQQKALQEQENAARERAGRTRLGYLLLFIVAVFAIAVMVWRKKRKESLEAMRATMSELGEVQHDLQRLQTQQETYQELMKEKTETISRLESDLASMQEQETIVAEKEQMIKQKNLELADLQKKNEQLNLQIEEERASICQLQAEMDKHQRKGLVAANEAEISLAESGVFLLLRKNKPLSFREWTTIRHVVSDKLPAFSQLLLSKKKMLNDVERMLCVLFRLHCTQKEICVLMGMKQSSVSKHASAIMMKLFNENGGSKMLQQHLEQFC